MVINGLRARVLLALICCTSMVGMLGCGNGFSLVDTGSIFQMPWQEKPDTMPGVVPPHERIAQLRETASSSKKLEPAEQESLSQRLAKEISDEADPLIRLEIVRAISVCNTPTAAKIIEAALSDTSADVRITACQVLGKRGGSQSVQLLSKTLASDISADVRLAATRALGETGDKAAVAGLSVALEDGDPAMQHMGVLSMKKCTNEDFGKDVGRWRQYARGETPAPPEPTSIADRIRELF
ncbi:MAG: HEAT repeat domain-containing protein [Pirellulales bacterium]|nr:HEAT repeat domain-containing protein [Pirellulales bacterium]